MKTDFTRQMILALMAYAAAVATVLAAWGSGITHAIFNF